LHVILHVKYLLAGQTNSWHSSMPSKCKHFSLCTFLLSHDKWWACGKQEGNHLSGGMMTWQVTWPKSNHCLNGGGKIAPHIPIAF